MKNRSELHNSEYTVSTKIVLALLIPLEVGAIVTGFGSLLNDAREPHVVDLPRTSVPLLAAKPAKPQGGTMATGRGKQDPLGPGRDDLILRR